MRRREFIVLSGAATVLLATAAGAQQTRTPKVAILVLGTPDPALFVTRFTEGLRGLGYVDGRNIQIELRSGGGDVANLAQAVSELVALGPDVIVGFQTPTVVAARQAARDIPIVMGTVGDPVGTGLVASLARPGGNITGMSGATAELGAKNLELTREVLPSVRRVAVLANAPDPFSRPFLEHIHAAAKALNIEIKAVMVRAAEELEAQVADIEAWRGQAIVVQPSLPHRRIADLALKHRLPAFCPNSGFPAAGGLMSYAADFEALYRRSAVFVDRILKGTKPADLPVELPTKFHLAINLKTAKALGVTVPGTMLTRADEVIE
ncbi:MAG: ABC transporter substrate-binding protein [Xanthobacteraceae bacterium]|nr:ABC transporter substrate-binding protein [Xanthobacteraceae bacterium]